MMPYLVDLCVRHSFGRLFSLFLLNDWQTLNVHHFVNIFRLHFDIKHEQTGFINVSAYHCDLVNTTKAFLTSLVQYLTQLLDFQFLNFFPGEKDRFSCLF